MLKIANPTSHKLKDSIMVIKGWKTIGFSKKTNGEKSLRNIRVCQLYKEKDG